MKKILLGRKVKVFVWLFVLAYGWMISSDIYNVWDDFVQGFVQGYDDANDPAERKFHFDVHSVTVKNKGDLFSFPDSIRDQRGQLLPASLHRLDVKTSNDVTNSSKWNVYTGVLMGLSFLLFAAILYIPLQLFRFVKRINTGIAFDRHNVRWLRKSGITLVFVYLLMVVFEYLHLRANQCVFDFENYTLTMDSTDGIYLVMGVGILLFAEVISSGIELKEEQELTI